MEPLPTTDNTRRVVIAEEDALVRQGLRSILSRPLFFIVAEVDHENDLMQAVKVNSPHLVIVGEALINKFGVQMISDMKRESQSAGFLLIGQAVGPETLIKGLKEGLDGYISTLASEGDIIRACQRVAKGDGPVLPDSAHDLLDYMLGQSDRSYGWNESRLTDRQYEVLECMSKGMSNKDIARELGLSETTVKSHVTAVLKKLGAADRTQAVIKAMQDQMIEPHTKAPDEKV